jgi:hypothetical protein
MSSTRNKKRPGNGASGGGGRGGGGKQQSGVGKSRSSEPSEQEMVMFHGLLRGKNSAAVAAHSEFSTSQDKDKFFQDIIAICRQPVHPGGGGGSGVQGAKVNGNVGSIGTPSSINATSEVVEDDSPPGIAKKTSLPPKKVVNDDEIVKKNRNEKSTLPLTNTCTSTATVAPVQKKKPVCSFFLSNGSCRKGKRCRFPHPEGELINNKWVAPKATDSTVITTTIENDSVVTQAVLPGSGVGGNTDVATSSSVTRGDIPRTNSVDNAMGLMDMDMKFLEENLDMRLEDKSPNSTEQTEQLQEPEGMYTFPIYIQQYVSF